MGKQNRCSNYQKYEKKLNTLIQSSLIIIIPTFAWSFLWWYNTNMLWDVKGIAIKFNIFFIIIAILIANFSIHKANAYIDDKNIWSKLFAGCVIAIALSPIFFIFFGAVVLEPKFEKLAFESARNEETVKSLIQFLDKYPYSKYSKEAVELRDWIYAKTIGTESTLKEYLSKYGSWSRFTDDANKYLDNVINQKRTIKVITEQSYADEKVYRAERIPLFEISKSIFESAGFSVVGENSDKYDFLIKINVSGESLSAWYDVSGYKKPQLCYPGARVNGKIFAYKFGNSRESYLSHFQGEIKPPFTSYIIRKYTKNGVFLDERGQALPRSPEYSPYQSAILTPLTEKLVEAISELDLGSLIILVRAHKIEGSYNYEGGKYRYKSKEWQIINEKAMSKVQDILTEKGRSVLPQLCNALKNSMKVQPMDSNAYESLRRILKNIKGSTICDN